MLILLLFQDFKNGRVQDGGGGSVKYVRSTNWKIQCKMALIKEGLWNIAARKDKALATIVLMIKPSLLYLIGADPTDSVHGGLEGTGRSISM